MLTPSAFAGRILKHIVLRPRVRRMAWGQLWAGAWKLKESFETRIAGETDESAEISAGQMNIKEILAHLAIANQSIASRLDALRSGLILTSVTPNLFPGSEGRTLVELRKEFEDSWRRLANAVSTPIRGERTEPHDFFGPMTAPEWVALIAYHHEYHSRQIDRIQATDLHRRARGSKF
jgi:uncharacterized damage-inducible protein DinB